MLPAGGLGLDLSPRLEAVDFYPGSRHSLAYEVTWEQVRGILGTAPPWFHWALRDKAAIQEWKPGDLPAVIPADDTEVPARPLLELAADEPDGSPVAAACLWLAREARARAAKAARDDIQEIRDEASKPGSDCAHVHIAAVPVPSLRPEETKPAETVLRAAWAQITERRDPLAWAVAELALRWDGGHSWPGGETAEFDPESCRAAAEWTAGLRPAPGGQPPTVLERLLLERVSDMDQAELLVDEASGCDEIYIDKGASGKLASRPEFDKALGRLRPGDTLVITRLARAMRSLRHLLNMAAGLRERSVGLVVLKQQIDTTTPQGRLVFHVLAAIDEFQRELIVDGTYDGLDAARARGRNGGRPPAMTDDQVRLARQLAGQRAADGRREYTITQVAKMLGVSRPTLYRALGKAAADGVPDGSAEGRPP